MNNSISKIFLLAILILSINFSSKSQAYSSVSLDSDGYNLVWQDLFNGTTLNSAYWTPEVNGDGGGNQELQYYRSENISVGKEPVSGQNCLIITAKKESFSGKTCTSGRLTTSNKMNFKYGKLVARVKLPHTGNGLWPAFWAMGQDISSVGWPKCGEIDILEMGNSEGIKSGTQDKYFNSWFHWGENGDNHPNWGKNYTYTSGIQDDFYLFTLIWDENTLQTYFGTDNNPLQIKIVEMAISGTADAESTGAYFKKNYFVLLNLAIGGQFTGIDNINNVTALNASNNYTAKMYVDYVKVYQKGISSENYYGPALDAQGVKEVKALQKFNVYPNPVSDVITVVGDETPASLSVLSLSGREMLKVSNANRINTQNLSAGNYLVNITNSAGVVETHQIIKK